MAFCTKCGTQVSEEIKFCTKCGNAMGAPNGQTAPAPTPAAPRPLPQQQFSGASPQTKNKSPLPIIIGAAAVLILVTAGIFVFVKRGDQSAKTQSAPDTEQVTQAEDPAAALEKLRVGMRVNSIDELVPDGWRKITQVSGDLNKDKVDDAAIVIEATATANKADGANYNPRVLLALLSDGGGYTLAGKTGTDFIPAESDRNNPCLADPLASGGIEITTRHTIRAVFNRKHKLDPNCSQLQGSNLERFIFRYQNNQFELIGADKDKFDGGQFGVSINFSTKDIERKTPSAAMVKGKVEIDKLYNMDDSHNAYKFLDDAIAGRLATVNPRDRLVGTWYWTNGMSYWHEYNLRGDGTFRFREYNAHTGEGVDHPGVAGTWRLNGNKITATYRSGATETYILIERGGKLYFNESGKFNDDYLRFEKSQ